MTDIATKKTEKRTEKFSVSVDYYFEVNKDNIRYAYQPHLDKSEKFKIRVTDDHQKLQILGKDGNWQDGEFETPPPYICNAVSAIACREAGSLKLMLCMQYLVLKPDETTSPGETGNPDETGENSTCDRICVSYDIMNSGDDCLRSATFDVIEINVSNFMEKQFLRLFNAGTTQFRVDNIPKCWLAAGFVDHDMTILSWDTSESGKTILKVRSRVTIRRHPYGEFASAYLIPRFPTSEKGKPGPLVLAGYAVHNGCVPDAGRRLSPIIRNNLEALELGMSGPTPKIVFIQGEPGSGKESFANAIHNGSKINHGKTYSEKAFPRSVAGMKLDQFRHAVFGEERDGVLIPGLIKQAGENTIFLDEFDKIAEGEDDIYAELLRVWEAKEYLPVGARELQEAKKVNWVVAGAFTSLRTTADLPPDIWSRFSAQISIQTPLSAHVETDDGRAQYIHALVFSFMLGIGIEEVSCQDKGIEKIMDALRSSDMRRDHIIGRILFKTDGGCGERLTPSKLLCHFAEALGKYLGLYWSVTVYPPGWDAETSTSVDLEYRRGKLAGTMSKPSQHGGHKLVTMFPELFKPRTYCVPRYFVDLSEKMARNRQPRRLCKEKWVSKSEPLKQRLFRTDEVSNDVLAVPQFDSIRAIRQACRVIFNRVLEWEIGAAKTKAKTKVTKIDRPAAQPDGPSAQTDSPAALSDSPTVQAGGPTAQTDSPATQAHSPSGQADSPAAQAEKAVRKILNEAFSTIDLARQGMGLEQEIGLDALNILRIAKSDHSATSIQCHVTPIANELSDQLP